MRFSKGVGQVGDRVKTGTIGRADLRSLAEFVVRNRAYHPLVLCDHPEAVAVERLGIEAMRWQDFLLDGPRPV